MRSRLDKLIDERGIGQRYGVRMRREMALHIADQYERARERAAALAHMPRDDERVVLVALVNSCDQLLSIHQWACQRRRAAEVVGRYRLMCRNARHRREVRVALIASVVSGLALVIAAFREYYAQERPSAPTPVVSEAR